MSGLREKLRQAQTSNASWLCVGLDPVLDRLPKCIGRSRSPFWEFCREIVESTQDVVCAYKPNLGFWLTQGSAGIKQLERLIDFIPDHIPVILDGKFGDVGHTAKAYAIAAFQALGVDAVTGNPYLGIDAIKPFLQKPRGGVFLLARTSNASAPDLQDLNHMNAPIYEHVAHLAVEWGRNYPGMCGLVVGATYPGELAGLRSIAPDLPFLIPGIGVQGGSLDAAVHYGPTADRVGPIINSSRGIIYASAGNDFALAARKAAKELRDRIKQHLREDGA